MHRLVVSHHTLHVNAHVSLYSSLEYRDDACTMICSALVKTRTSQLFPHLKVPSLGSRFQAFCRFEILEETSHHAERRVATSSTALREGQHVPSLTGHTPSAAARRSPCGPHSQMRAPGGRNTGGDHFFSHCTHACVPLQQDFITCVSPWVTTGTAAITRFRLGSSQRGRSGKETQRKRTCAPVLNYFG